MALVLALAWASPGLADDTQGAPELAEARRRADAAAEALGKRLMGELTTALATGGAAEAMRVCATIAQEVTRAVGREQDVVVRRTSLRFRNRANAPDEFERAWLLQAEDRVRHGRPAEPVYHAVLLDDGKRELRHLRPIMFPGGVCSQCHGPASEISAEVNALLRERYPDDRATEFSAGDLRGAISVRVRLPDAAGTGADGGGEQRRSP